MTRKREGPEHSHQTGNAGLATLPMFVPLLNSQIEDRDCVRSGASPLDSEE